MDSIVRGGTQSFRVCCSPKGGELRDLTQDDSVRWVQWFSAAPGMLSLLGLLLHHTVYRSEWSVTVEPQGSTIGNPFRVDGLRKKDALQMFDALVVAIGRGESLDRFESQARTS